MKRKYDLRNKRNFVIILILGLFIIGIFSLFIYKYLHASKTQYDVAIGSVLQDTNKNYVNIEDAATLGTRWNGTYYLNYQDNKVNVGKRVVVYNTVTGKINLYGKFYQINADGKIKELNDESTIENTSDASFYKLADREYLLVDKKIVSDDGSINANNYLLVELDKMGNAKISNNKLNLKTISPTKLITSKYTFDIANEKLKFNNLDIDLKKIIGSTNEYKEEEKKEEDNSNNNQDNNNDVNNWINNNNVNVDEIGGGIINNNENQGTVTTLDDIKNKVKSTSIIRWSQTFTEIDIDYIVYDLFDEYTSVYILLDDFRRIDLDKEKTHVTINGLIPDHTYQLDFIYTTIDKETNQSKPTTFDSIAVKMSKPVYTGKVTGFYYSPYQHLTYKIDLQKGYKIDSLDATLTVFHNIIDENGNVSEQSVPIKIHHENINANSSYVTGEIDLSKEGINNIVKLDFATVVINSVSSGNVTIKY